MKETSKAVLRRLHDSRFATTFFKGSGIDIGCGDDPLSKYRLQFPLIEDLRPWDLPDGDAQLMSNVPNDSYDFVHSSHCLEHLSNPYEAFKNWLRICKPNGHIVVTVPDEDLYEQGQFPSTFSPHLTTWTILKDASWSPASIGVFDFLYQFRTEIEVIKVELINGSYIYGIHRFDQTQFSISECAIEFIVRKLAEEDKKLKGRYPTR